MLDVALKASLRKHPHQLSPPPVVGFDVLSSSEGGCWSCVVPEEFQGLEDDPVGGYSGMGEVFIQQSESELFRAFWVAARILGKELKAEKGIIEYIWVSDWLVGTLIRMGLRLVLLGGKIPCLTI